MRMFLCFLVLLTLPIFSVSAQEAAQEAAQGAASPLWPRVLEGRPYLEGLPGLEGRWLR